MDRNRQITSWAEFLWKLEICFPSIHGVAYSIPSTPILTSDLKFNSNATTDTALESLIIADPDSDDLVSEECDSSSQPSDSYFASDLDHVVDSDADSDGDSDGDFSLLPSKQPLLPLCAAINPSFGLTPFAMGTAITSPEMMVMATPALTAMQCPINVFDPGGTLHLVEKGRLGFDHITTMSKSDSHLSSTSKGGISSLNWLTFKSLSAFIPHSRTVICHTFSHATNYILVGFDESRFVNSNLFEHVVQFTFEDHSNKILILLSLSNPLPVLACATINFPIMLLVLFDSQAKVYFEWGITSILVENVFSVVVIISCCKLGGIFRSKVTVLYTKQGNTHNAFNMFERSPVRTIVASLNLIAGCARIGLHNLLSSLFMDMVQLGNSNSDSRYRHTYLQNFVYAKILLHPHPHIVPCDSNSSGALFWCTNGWIQQYLQDQCGIVKMSGNSVSPIGITFILGKLGKLPLALPWVHLLSNFYVSYHGEGFEFLTIPINGTSFSLCLAYYCTCCCYTSSLLLISMKFSIVTEFMQEGPILGWYDNVLTSFGVLLLMAFPSITKCWHEKKKELQSGHLLTFLVVHIIGLEGKRQAQVEELAKGMTLALTQEETGQHVRMLPDDIKNSLAMHVILKMIFEERGAILPWEKHVQNRDQLMMQNFAFNLAQQEAKMSVHTLNDFLVVMADKMRTPMHALIALSSLLLGIYIDTSSTLELAAKSCVLAPDCHFMELQVVWLRVRDVGSIYSNLVLKHLVTVCACWLGGRYMQFANVERFVQNFHGHFIIARSGQTHCFRFYTPKMSATTLITRNTHFHVLLCESPYAFAVQSLAANVSTKRANFTSLIIYWLNTMKWSSSLYGNITQLRMDKGQQWNPGEHFQVSKVLGSLQSKQWDPGKLIHRENFYNLEDKVDFEGVGNDMIIGIKKIMVVLVYSRRGFLGIVFE